MDKYAFTTYYKGLSNKLINSAVLIFEDKEFKTDYAQWDTGATNTCISKNVVEKLGLIPSGQRPIQTPSGKKIVNEYRIDIKLQNEDVHLPNMFVLDSEIGEQGIDILIGMDIINRGDFSVSNFENKTTFTFRIPSNSMTDYVKLMESSKPIKKATKIHPNDLCPCGSGKKYKRCCGKK